MTKARSIGFAVVSVILLALIILIGPANAFTHGFYCDEPDLEAIKTDAATERVPIGDQRCAVEFSPRKDRFKGFQLYFERPGSSDNGKLKIELSDAKGNTIETSEVDISSIIYGRPYCVYLNSDIKKGKTYRLEFSTEGTELGPLGLLVSPGFRPAENSSGELLVGYAYAKPTFKTTERVLIILFLLAIWLFALSALLKDRKTVRLAACLLLLATALTWNFMYNAIDDRNTEFGEFQLDSEELVTDVLKAQKQGIGFADKGAQHFGLGLIDPDSGKLIGYQSQYGLQGKVFRLAGRFVGKDALHLLCAFAAAVVFVLISYLIYRHYNMLLAVCFYITFMLSPWIVNFARNLYWMEFTWFLPMLAGLFCAWKADSRKARIFSYIAVFICITAKCLCGYEYISTIMMAMIAFPVVDMISALVRKDYAGAKRLLISIIILGVVAIAGFVTAICLHASIAGGGSLSAGIRQIIERDVLRRTSSGNLNNIDAMYWESLNASVWETLRKYFHFETQVICGIDGNLFVPLCLTPLAIFFADRRKPAEKAQDISMYVIFLLAAISWFCLAKGHSYIHTTMSFVLWYFGFVQTCLYIIVNGIYRAFSKKADMQK